MFYVHPIQERDQAAAGEHLATLLKPRNRP